MRSGREKEWAGEGEAGKWWRENKMGTERKRGIILFLRFLMTGQ